MSGIILYPTDTIYGLGVDATDAEAVARLITLKGRDEKKPISIAVADIAMMEEYADVTPLARKLARAFLPGKLTLVLTAKDTLAPALTAGTGTIGIRIPKHLLVERLIREIGKPITATSANVSGREPEKTPEKILAQFGGNASSITKVYDLGELPESAPSTVVDARGTESVVLREGAIPSDVVTKV
ncbi:MAG: L-threonylcarbamoyladenylate synthase [Patescibacteria group bacterium]